MNDPKLIRETAQRYKALARSINNSDAAERIEELARELERKAEELETATEAQPD